MLTKGIVYGGGMSIIHPVPACQTIVVVVAAMCYVSIVRELVPTAGYQAHCLQSNGLCLAPSPLSHSAIISYIPTTCILQITAIHSKAALTKYAVHCFLNVVLLCSNCSIYNFGTQTKSLDFLMTIAFGEEVFNNKTTKIHGMD